MKLTDIIALAKAGYTAAEVKELAALEVAEAGSAPEPNRAAEPAEQQTMAPEQPQPEEEPVAHETMPERDNKELEELSQKVIDLEAKLAAAQKANTKKDLSGSEPTSAEAFADVMRNFM